MENNTQKPVTSPDWRDQLLPTKELAARIARSPRYVYAMKRDGFPMPGRRATVNDAINWLAKNPNFKVNKNKPHEPCGKGREINYD